MEQVSVKRYSLSEQVSDKLEKMIEKGEFKIGEKIPTETELMELFSVSRNTIREAIKYLSSAGLLDVRQGDGTYIKSNNRFEANMNRKLENTSYDEINEARKTLEFSIVSLACQRRNEEDLKEIKQALDLRQTTANTIKENSIADVNFHISIAKAAHNDILLDLYKSLYSYLIQRIETKLEESKFNPKKVDKLHEDLFKAIVNQDENMVKKVAIKILDI